MSDHVVVDLCYESAVLKDGNKLSGRDKSHIVGDPSDECFGAHEFVGPGIVFRLIVNFEFFLLDGFSLFLGDFVDPLFIFDKFCIEESDTCIVC